MSGEEWAAVLGAQVCLVALVVLVVMIVRLDRAARDLRGAARWNDKLSRSTAWRPRWRGPRHA